MSTLKVDGIRSNSASSDAITLASDGTCTANITNNLSNRRLTINGDMRIVQRGTVTGVQAGYGGLNRFKFDSNHSVVTMSQSTDVPTGQGFVKSLKLDVTTAGGISNANTYTQIDHRIEGQDLQSLCYGTSNAKTTKLTFWIKSPKTGTHWVRLYSSEIGNKFNSKKYTVTAANTWQKVTLTFGGYTSQGFDNDNSIGLRISWYFGQGSDFTSGTDADGDEWLTWHNNNAAVGQVNCFDSTSNDIYLTGVQFEVGDHATDFEHRSYGDELARCQRYYYLHAEGNNQIIGTATLYQANDIFLVIAPKVTMRGTPTIDQATGTNYYKAYNAESTDQFDSFGSTWNITENTLTLNASSGQGVSLSGSGNSVMIITNNSGAKLGFSAEL